MVDANSLRHIAHSRAPLSTWVAVVLIFALFGVIVLAIVGPSPRGNDYEEARAKKRMENLKNLREDAEKALDTYAWVDKAKGLVRIPISRAMELTTGELAQKKPAAAGPIATAQPQASPSAATGASRSSPATSAPPKSAAAKPPGSPAAPAPASSASPPAQTAASAPAQVSSSASPVAQPAQSVSGSPSPATTP